MQPAPRTSYDEVPYDSKAFTETHPDRLATVATLFGMQPQKVEQCRVLELGCADGANLIPMAAGLPESTFVGIDLSSRQVGDGQAVIAQLGLKNIELRTASILNINESEGVFDYIICHGVYSWVPPEVQEHILTICRQNLAPAGVAYVSYNTYPGWHVRRMVRDLLCYHARRSPDPLEQVRQARAFIEFLGQAVVVDPTSTYSSTIRGAAEALRQRSDSYFLHEYLEEHNEPLYFHQFA
jgi:SAM-dependent methyltransferase